MLTKRYPSFCSLLKYFSSSFLHQVLLFVHDEWIVPYTPWFVLLFGQTLSSFFSFFIFCSFLFRFLLLQSGCRRLSTTGKRVLPVQLLFFGFWSVESIRVYTFTRSHFHLHSNAREKGKEKKFWEFKEKTYINRPHISLYLIRIKTKQYYSIVTYLFVVNVIWGENGNIPKHSRR